MDNLPSRIQTIIEEYVPQEVIKLEIAHITKYVLNIIESYLPERVCIDECMYKQFITTIMEAYSFRDGFNTTFYDKMLTFNNLDIIFDTLDIIIDNHSHSFIDWQYVYFTSPLDWSRQILDRYGDYIWIDSLARFRFESYDGYLAVYDKWLQSEGN